MDYNLEIEKAIEKINLNSARKVLIQLPDGLKPRAKEIKDKIQSFFKGKCYPYLFNIEDVVEKLPQIFESA